MRAELESYLHAFFHARAEPCPQNNTICTAARSTPTEHSLYPPSLQFHIKVLLKIWLHSESFISVQSILNTAFSSVSATITVLVQSIFVKPYLHFNPVYIYIFYQTGPCPQSNIHSAKTYSSYIATPDTKPVSSATSLVPEEFVSTDKTILNRFRNYLPTQISPSTSHVLPRVMKIKNICPW